MLNLATSDGIRRNLPEALQCWFSFPSPGDDFRQEVLVFRLFQVVSSVLVAPFLACVLNPGRLRRTGLRRALGRL